MNIEEIINSALTRLNQDQELRRLALLELIYKNIDSLIDNSSVWFGENVPREFKKVIQSLMIISTSFLGEEYDFREMIFDDPVEEVKVKLLISEIVREMCSIDENKSFSLEDENSEPVVITSRKKLKNSLISIFLAFMVFMDKDSRCVITVRENKSSVILSLVFSDLLSSFPGVDRMQKAFFPYFFNNDYRIGIGIDFSLYMLRNIGSVVKFSSTTYGETGASIDIVFPSLEFQDILNEIRNSQSSEVKEKREGLVHLMTDDITLEMVIGEMLNENGYRINKIDLPLSEHVCTEASKAVIIDYASLVQKEISPSRFREIFAWCPKIILIHGAESQASLHQYFGPAVIPLIKPFNLERIIQTLEMDRKSGNGDRKI